MKKKVVLAYSGGLDTSYCIKYLTQELGHEVIAVTVETGGFDHAEIKALEKRALNLGATSFKVIDAKKGYYDQCIKYLLFGNVLRNNTYPLSVSAERVFQGQEIVKYALEQNADAIAHGSTGAGNDQVRFDSIIEIMAPNVEIITPIRDLKLTRKEEVDYLKGHGVEIEWEKAKYSINQGLWGTSVGGKETLTSNQYLPESAWPNKLESKESQGIRLSFEQGNIIGLNRKRYEHPVELIQYLDTIVGSFAIGRDIHVGDTIIGIKGRVGFEAPAPLLLIKAHHLLEKHCLTKWQQYWKEQLANWYGMFLHEGQFLDPVMRNIETFLEDTQQYVTGDVLVKLHPYRFELIGVESKNDLMQSDAGQYGEMNDGWSGDDVKGFTRIFSNAHKIFHSMHQKD